MPAADAILGDAGKKPPLLEEDGELLITGNVTSRWSAGHTAEVVVEDVSDDDIIDPEVGFDLPASMPKVWNGEVSQSSEGFRVQDNNANTLEPGEAWRFVFVADGDEAMPAKLMAQGGDGQQLDVQVLGLGNTDIEEVAA